MEPRLSLITLGVTDLARARAFDEGTGWPPRQLPAAEVGFFQPADGTVRVAADA